MANDVELVGIEENLKRFAVENKRVRDAALKKGAEFLRQELERNAPISEKNNPQHKHMRDYTITTKIDSDGVIKVGFKKYEVGWRVHFVEFGTIFQRPRPFMDQVVSNARNEFYRIVNAEIRRLM